MSPFCPFCDYEGPSPVLFDFGDVFVFEPLSPVVSGHLLVVPRRHVEDFGEDPRLSGLVMECAARIVGGDAMPPTPQPRTVCNVITSIGEAATQSVKHLHVHLVPRFPGDGLKLPWSP